MDNYKESIDHVIGFLSFYKYQKPHIERLIGVVQENPDFLKLR